MTTIATLEPSVRLVVFKFLMKSRLVPDFIPRMSVNSINRSGSASPIEGKKILPSTPDVWLGGLLDLLNRSEYVFVGARADERADGRSDVRFTLCHRWHLNDTPSHPKFIEKFDELIGSLVELIVYNIWTTMCHINPYMDMEGIISKGRVIMLDCAGRKPLINSDGDKVMVYAGGREKLLTPGIRGRGIGPKIPLLNKANRLNLVGKEVQLITS